MGAHAAAAAMASNTRIVGLCLAVQLGHFFTFLQKMVHESYGIILVDLFGSMKEDVIENCLLDDSLRCGADPSAGFEVTAQLAFASYFLFDERFHFFEVGVVVAVQLDGSQSLEGALCGGRGEQVKQVVHFGI